MGEQGWGAVASGARATQRLLNQLGLPAGRMQCPIGHMRSLAPGPGHGGPSPVGTEQCTAPGLVLASPRLRNTAFGQAQGPDGDVPFLFF